MDIREKINQYIILKIKVGSHLYGTNTPESDEDYAGIFVTPPEYLLGLQNVEEVDLSIKNKLENGKNSPDAIDFKLYSLNKFIRLALDNNPNILEMLFVNNDNILFINDVGKELLKLRYEFLSKNIKHRFLGYAVSQKHKMVIKLDNYEKLLEAKNILENIEDKKFLLELLPNPLFIKKKDLIKVADINLPATATVKRAKRMINDRLSKFGSRKQLVTKYGFDTKFGAHLIRLLLEGLELLETSDLKLPLVEAELIKSIRYGKYELKELLELAEHFESKIELAYENSKLPHKPNRKLIEQWLIDVNYKTILTSKKDGGGEING